MNFVISLWDERAAVSDRNGVVTRAIYYYKLRREGFLIGVTLEQSEVDPTDRKLSELANEILVYLGGRPDDDFYRK